MTTGEKLSKVQTETLISLLSIPDHLRKTLLVTQLLGLVSASDVANRTGRARAVESGYLNQLRTIGLVKKERHSRTAYFRPQSQLKPKEVKKGLYKKLIDMSNDLRQILFEDLLTAMESRIEVFSKVSRNSSKAC